MKTSKSLLFFIGYNFLFYFSVAGQSADFATIKKLAVNGDAEYQCDLA